MENVTIENGTKCIFCLTKDEVPGVKMGFYHGKIIACCATNSNYTEKYLIKLIGTKMPQNTRSYIVEFADDEFKNLSPKKKSAIPKNVKVFAEAIFVIGKNYYNERKQPIEIGEQVYVFDYTKHENIPAKVVAIGLEPNTYLVKYPGTSSYTFATSKEIYRTILDEFPVD